jgi:hypothetical protein
VKWDDIRRIDNHGHSSLAVRHLGAVQPNGIGVVNLEHEHVARGSVAAPDGVGSHSLAGVGEGGSCDGVAGCKGKLNRVASSGYNRVGGEDESVFANGDLVNV